MKQILVISAILCGLFGLSPSFAGEAARPDPCHGMPCSGHSEADSSFRPAMIPDNLRPFLPSDMVYSLNSNNFECDTNGQHARPSNQTSNCLPVLSRSNNKKHFLLRYADHGQSEMLFVTVKSRLVPYVQLNGPTVAYQSPEAQQFAASNGYRLNERTSTMVAMNQQDGTTQSAAAINCKNPANINERLACLKGTANTGSEPAQTASSQPVPSAVQPEDCSQMHGFIAKAKCISEKAKALSTLPGKP